MKTATYFVSRCRPWLIALSVVAGCLSGCQTTPPAHAYKSEAFSAESPFQYYSNREPGGACEIGKRALLSQGYQLETTQELNIRGEKYFQPTAERVTKLTITLVCLPSDLGAVIYANALETQFELKSSGNTAGVSVSGMGSVSLPWSINKDTLVKIGDVTITEPEFYQRLFELIKTLDG